VRPVRVFTFAPEAEAGRAARTLGAPLCWSKYTFGQNLSQFNFPSLGKTKSSYYDEGILEPLTLIFSSDKEWKGRWIFFLFLFPREKSPSITPNVSLKGGNEG